MIAVEQRASMPSKLRTSGDKRPSELFENMVNVSELIALATKWLRRKKPISRNTIYVWKKQGMPGERICGELLFDKDEAALWIMRTRGGNLQDKG